MSVRLTEEQNKNILKIVDYEKSEKITMSTIVRDAVDTYISDYNMRKECTGTKVILPTGLVSDDGIKEVINDLEKLYRKDIKLNEEAGSEKYLIYKEIIIALNNGLTDRFKTGKNIF